MLRGAQDREAAELAGIDAERRPAGPRTVRALDQREVLVSRDGVHRVVWSHHSLVVARVDEDIGVEDRPVERDQTRVMRQGVHGLQALGVAVGRCADADIQAHVLGRHPVQRLGVQQATEAVLSLPQPAMAPHHRQEVLTHREDVLDW